MAQSTPQLRAIDRLASLALILEGALAVRVLAADVVQWYVDRRQTLSQTLCVFPDADLYWILAGTIRDGTPYEVVEWGDIPHFALRTPGYPLFLAACRALFGDRPLMARLVQAVLGTLTVWLVARLAAQIVQEQEPRPVWTVATLTAALAAFDPFVVSISAFLLSEALFVPLMIVSLWGLAMLWPSRGDATGRSGWIWALTTGFATGAAVLTRPSWALFAPAALGCCVIASRGYRGLATRRAAVVVLGVAVVMAPWWVRNARIYGRFVPTALWMGASLYDGLNPNATGASDMLGFLFETEVWPLDEEAQDALLRSRALAFVREQPGQALWLAMVKLGRFWSPWPNADTFQAWPVAVASALITLPQFALMAVGAWDRRRDPRAIVVLLGPLIYFMILHMIFASSMRYRIPAAVPALALAAIGLRRLLDGWRRQSPAAS
jgi:4-amino-4-deoxy-L-arabinose transferase-like glycosyltransferase